MKTIIFSCIVLISLSGMAQSFTPDQIRTAHLKSFGENAKDTSYYWQDIEIESVDHPLLGKDAPDLKETDLQGGELHIGQEGKIQVISFGHINCGPCLLEIPQLNMLFEDYENDSTVEIISISLSSKEELLELQDITTDILSMQTAQDMSGGGQMLFPVVPRGKIESLRYLVFNYPTTFVTDLNGQIRFVDRGFTLTSDPDYFYKKLKKVIETIKLGEKIVHAD